MRHMLILLATLLCAPLAPAATLLVLNKEDATLWFVDPDSGRMLATLPTGEGPHEVEVTRDGRTAVVTNYGQQGAGNSLSVVDVAARRERARADLGTLQRPHGLAIVGQEGYFTAEDAQHIGAVDLATGRLTWQFATQQQGTHMIVASRDGRRLFTTNMGSDSVSLIERTAGSAAKQVLVQVGDVPEGLDLSPDGRELWVANAASGNLSIIDVAQQKLVKTFDIGTRRSNRLKFTPDGALALVSDLTAGELVVVDARTHTVKQRLPIGRGASGILIVPDGSRAYVAAAGERRLAIVDLKNLRVVGQVSTGGGPDGMAWVP